jgi:hypothetical protein
MLFRPRKITKGCKGDSCNCDERSWGYDKEIIQYAGFMKLLFFGYICIYAGFPENTLLFSYLKVSF